jgi:short subunit fatty acids transporter
MFPFNYIPENISPTIRKLIISLITIQFIAFLILIITLIYEFCLRKRNKTVEIKEHKEESKEKNEEEKKEDTKAKKE